VSTQLSRHGEIERDDFTLDSAIIVELGTRQREIGDEDENKVADTSGNKKPGVGRS
jgi:hypothetical protein